MAIIRPNADLSSITPWVAQGSGTGQYDRLSDSDTNTGLRITYPDANPGLLYELENPSVGIDTSQPVTLNISANADLASAAVIVRLIDPDDSNEEVCAPSFSVTIGGFATYSYSLNGTERARLDHPASLRALIDGVTYTGTDDSWLQISELWVEYTESSGGGPIAKRQLLPLLGVG